jgi:hypothetical protein
MAPCPPINSGADVSERAKLCPKRAAAACLCVFLAACAPAPVHGQYDEQTRALLRLDYDPDGDGAVDVRTYMQGTRPYRTEADTDRDGRIDRWEYLDATARIVLVGTSSQGDGVEDQWSWPPGDNGERQAGYSRSRDRVISRREFFRADRLVRAEEDNNSDGLADKWEEFEAGVLRRVSFDTGHSTGRPDRRLVYGVEGMYERLELDPEGDGIFVAAR